MLNFTQVTLRRGVRALFTDATFIIHAGNKVGVTGANGTGKSSLFAMLRGELHVDEGDFSMPPKLEIAHVAQETPALSVPAIEYVIDGDRALRAAQAELAQAESDGDGHKLAEAHAHIEALDGYTAESRAARLLDGLGFTQAQQRTPVADFSGGWRMRLNLAQALMCRSDLLLLDEPTNHLDLDAVIWLEDWLRSYPGTLLLISHDRDFLDRVVGHIAHIEQGGVTLYTGNYSAFERQRAAQLAQQQAAYEKQQREKAHMHSFVERFRAKATKARQAQSRLKALARMEEIAPAHVDSPFHFEFRRAEAVPSPMLNIEKAAFGYGDKRVLDGINFTLMPGDRIGLLGANGAGKSTLIKALAGELAAQQGGLLPAKTLRIGYFAQHQLEQLDPAASPLLHLQRLDKKATEKDLRNYLGGFGFNGDQALAASAPFSGGEKARLVLALLVYQKPNLLLLDEPTNHLDLEMRHALTVALQGFEGAMVVVSHDRHILRSVADSLWLVADGRVKPFDDDLDGYARWLAEQRSRQLTEQPGAASGGDHSAEAKKARKRAEADRRKALQPLKRRVERAEKLVEKLESQLAAIEEKLADSSLYEESRKQDLKAMLAEQADCRGQLDEAEGEWMEASEALEAAESEAV